VNDVLAVEVLRYPFRELQQCQPDEFALTQLPADTSQDVLAEGVRRVRLSLQQLVLWRLLGQPKERPLARVAFST
jgi:hypothetical protein